MIEKQIAMWGALWRSRNNTDGMIEQLIRREYAPVLFRTRQEAREFIDREYGYIATRPDLLGEPHGWKMPVAVKVEITWR